MGNTTRANFNLDDETQIALDRLRELTGSNKTECASRAIKAYLEIIEAYEAGGETLVSRKYGERPIRKWFK